MTPEIEALARRAVACRGWRWMPGMVTTAGVRVLRRDDDGYTIGYGPRTSYCMMEVGRDALPDLTDPATLGCLLALVREAWGDPLAYTMAYYGRWTLCSDRDEEIDPGDGLTEAEALIAALEAAP